MKLENIFDMDFFCEMHFFHSFLSNEPIEIVEIFTITLIRITTKLNTNRPYNLSLTS